MLGHDLAAALPGLRAHAESRMTSTATIRRKTGGSTTDADGYRVPEWEVVHVELPCRFPSPGSGASGTRTVSTPAGETQVAARRWDCPALTDNLRDGDYIDVTAGRMAETVWHLIEVTPADQETARRCPVEQVERPSEWT